MPSSFISVAFDVGTLRGLGTLVVVIAFTCAVLWTYSGKRKNSFAEAANLPFADECKAKKHAKYTSRSTC